MLKGHWHQASPGVSNDDDDVKIYNKEPVMTWVLIARKNEELTDFIAI